MKPRLSFSARLREALRILRTGERARDDERPQADERLLAIAQARMAVQGDALRHAERFQTALNNMLDGLCMFDAKGRLIVCNARYAEMYRLPQELTQPGASWTAIEAHRVRAIGYSDLTLDQVTKEHIPRVAVVPAAARRKL